MLVQSPTDGTSSEGDKDMKICVVGAGAIGGFIGARLAAQGEVQVSALARGATLQALRTQGWRLQQGGALIQVPTQASDRAADLGAQDVVFLAVKGPALAQVVPQLLPLLRPDTLLVPAMNGVPWWFNQHLAGTLGEPLQTVDPGGAVAAAVPLAQVVGCVVHASTSTSEPGLVQHKMGQGLVLGEPDGGQSDRVQQLVEVLQRAGFDATHSADIRQVIWYKLWGNLTMNPVSALTGATSDRVLGDPQVRDFCSAAMREAALVGAAIGCKIEQSPEDRHAITTKLGAFKSSMLQDAEAGRAIELDSIVAAVREIGQRLGQPTPTIDALFGLARLFGQTHGLYPV
jgi:2-dehydropantoate 2-reductase